MGRTYHRRCARLRRRRRRRACTRLDGWGGVGISRSTGCRTSAGGTLALDRTCTLLPKWIGSYIESHTGWRSGELGTDSRGVDWRRRSWTTGSGLRRICRRHDRHNLASDPRRRLRRGATPWQTCARLPTGGTPPDMARRVTDSGARRTRHRGRGGYLRTMAGANTRRRENPGGRRSVLCHRRLRVRQRVVCGGSVGGCL